MLKSKSKFKPVKKMPLYPTLSPRTAYLQDFIIFSLLLLRLFWDLFTDVVNKQLAASRTFWIPHISSTWCSQVKMVANAASWSNGQDSWIQTVPQTAESSGPLLFVSICPVSLTLFCPTFALLFCFSACFRHSQCKFMFVQPPSGRPLKNRSQCCPNLERFAQTKCQKGLKFRHFTTP
jgi:hypothetical protein